MKLEKFDLEKVIYGARVVTRDGLEVTQLSKFDTHRNLCLYGVVNDEVECWTIDGQYLERRTSNMDLFLVGKVQSIWVNIYRKSNNGEMYIGSQRYKSKQNAINAVSKEDQEYIKTIEITDEP
jgi:hypothetical protein